jgi:hypothetical protein
MGGTMRWAELRMCRFWAGGISSFPFSRAREYRLLRRLGEFQTTSALRMDGWHKGYTSGQPDIIIANPMNGYNGFAIELKTPKRNSRIKDNQHKARERLDDLGYKTMISNDYTEIILEIHKYFQVDKTKVYKNEIKQLKHKCAALKRELNATQCIYHPVFSRGKY